MLLRRVPSSWALSVARVIAFSSSAGVNGCSYDSLPGSFGLAVLPGTVACRSKRTSGMLELLPSFCFAVPLLESPAREHG